MFAPIPLINTASIVKNIWKIFNNYWILYYCAWLRFAPTPLRRRLGIERLSGARLLSIVGSVVHSAVIESDGNVLNAHVGGQEGLQRDCSGAREAVEWVAHGAAIRIILTSDSAVRRRTGACDLWVCRLNLNQLKILLNMALCNLNIKQRFSLKTFFRDF
jgi:hypothetical protein